jgi:AcrR family transcriptional regulator
VTAVQPDNNVRRGPGRPPNSSGELTKLRVLEAAIEAFGRGGFSATSSKTIASEAGVTPATVYHHFANKRQLYVAAFQHSIDIAWSEYDEVAANGGDALLDELTAVVRHAHHVIQGRPAMAMLAIRAAIDLGRDEVDRTIPDRVSAGMAQRAVARGELDVGDVRLVRPLVELVLWGVSVVGRGDDEILQRCEDALDLLLHDRLVHRPARRRRTG